MLLLTSFLASIDFHELEEPVVIEETGARAGADPSVMAITTPKETTDTGRNALQVGEATTFSAFIQNSGDADINEMGYTVTIYLTDSAGNAGMIAKGPSGADLQWNNPDVMCDDASVCDFDSSNGEQLAAGAYLDGGKHQLLLQGGAGPITWTPTQGEYLVEIKVNSPTDADIANNAELVYVKVEDWYDISVDLQWTSGDNPDSLDAAGLQAGEFTLTVEANGSDTFSPREVLIEVKTTANTAFVQTATLDGQAIPLDGTPLIVTAGTEDTNDDGTVDTLDEVNIEENESDPNATQTALRHTLAYQNAWTVNGELVPGSSNDSRFEITAEVVGYTLYGQFDDCIETYTPIDSSTGEEGETETWMNFCEVDFANDDRPKTDFDEITGSKERYDDIRIARMGVHQGYNSDCTGVQSSFVQAGTGADLNVGCALLIADVEHRGSDATTNYGWNVTYTMTDETGSITTGVVNDCQVGVGPGEEYAHNSLGLNGTAMPSAVGKACVMLQVAPGAYTFEMDLLMNPKGGPDPVDPMVNSWTGANDARTGNNKVSMDATVLNNLPVITSFELVTEGDIVVGQEGLLQFAATAFDVDDPSGAGLNFTYNYQGGEIGGCKGSQEAGFNICNTPVLAEFIGNLVVTVVVTDTHGDSVSKEMTLDVWNNAVATATSDAGITIEYPLQYFALSEFTITTFADADASSYDNVQLEGFSGSYAAVAAVDYAPSTTFQANDILSQSLSVTVDNALNATSLWYIDSSNKWVLLSDTATEVDASTEMFTYSFAANSPVLPAGKMVLMGGELAQATAPDAYVSGFNAAAQKQGAIALNWEITNTLRNADNVKICISEDNTTVTVPDCDGGFADYGAKAQAGDYSYSGSQTTHGAAYHITIAVCNDQGCSTIGVADVTADKRVDGDFTVSNLAVEVNADGNSWDLTWDVSGDTSDVAMWHVCKGNSEFDAANMPMDCGTGVAVGTTTVNVDMGPVNNGKFTYFTVVAMDDKGHMSAAGHMNEAQDTRVDDTSNPDDGNNVIDDGGDGASSGVPTWTWGLIGGVVIVAFVAGAFILSRGDGEGGEGKDWDY
ncbi:MAG: hypothetical protein DWC10_02615 [Candidatus Poseidoniales archaeon]|nr:MAG: hypothetical protein DWC10_02615 [Candidatus Poseidoniales archaeon]